MRSSTCVDAVYDQTQPSYVVVDGGVLSWNDVLDRLIQQVVDEINLAPRPTDSEMR